MKPSCTLAPPNTEDIDTFQGKLARSSHDRSSSMALPTPHPSCVHYVFSKFPYFHDTLKCTAGVKSSFFGAIRMIKCDLIEIDTLLLLPNKTHTPRKQTVVSSNTKEPQWVSP